MANIINEAERLVSNNVDTNQNQIKLPGELIEKKEKKKKKRI